MNEGRRYDIMEATSVLRIHIYPDSSEEILTVVSPISVNTEPYNITKRESVNNYYTDSGIDSSALTSPQQNLDDFSPEKRRESSSVYFVPINSHQIPEEEEGDIISERTLSFPDLKNSNKIGDSYRLTRSQERVLNSSSTINSSEIDIPEEGEEGSYIIEDSFQEDYQDFFLREERQISQTIEEGEKEIFVVGAEVTVSYLLRNTIQEAGIVEATVFPKAYTHLEEIVKIYPFTKKIQDIHFIPLYSLVSYITTNKKKELKEVPLYNIVDYIKHPKKIELDYCDIRDFVDIKEDNKISVTVEANKENIGSIVAYRYPTTAQHLKVYYDIDIIPREDHTTISEEGMASYKGYKNTLGSKTSIPLDEIYPSSKAFPQMSKHVYKHDIIRSNSITSVRSNAPDVNGIIDIQMSVGKNYTIPATDDSFGFYVRGGDKKKNESTLVISHVKKNSPSDVCGLMIGDNIISINGILLENLSLIKAERLYEESIKDKHIAIKISREKKLKSVLKNEVVLLNKTPEMYDNTYHKRKEDYKISSSPQSDLGEELLEEDHHNHHNYQSQTTVPSTTSIYRSSNKNDKENGDILNIKTQQQQSSFHNTHSPSTSVINSTVLNFSPNSYTTSGIESNHSFSPRSDSGASSSGGMSDYKVSSVDSKKKEKIGKVINFIPEADRQRYPNYSKYTTNIDEIEQDYHSAGLTPIHDVDSQPKLLRNYNYKLIEKSTQIPDSSKYYDRREATYLPPNRHISYDDEDNIEEVGKDIISKSYDNGQNLQRSSVVEIHPQYEKNKTTRSSNSGKKDRSSGIRRSLEKAGYQLGGGHQNIDNDNLDDDNESYITVPSRVQSILKNGTDEDIYYDVKYDRNDEGYEEVRTTKSHNIRRQNPLTHEDKVTLKPDEYILKDEETTISEGVIRYYDRDMHQIGRAYSYEESTTTSLIEDQDELRKIVRQQRLPAPGDPYSKNRIDADNRYENVSKSLEKQIKKKKEIEEKTRIDKETIIKEVSGKKVCGHCDRSLNQGAAMIIESLKLQFHLSCFNCIECGKQLGNGTTGTDVRVRGRKLYCKNCYHNSKSETGTENRISTTSSKMLNRIQV
uniref:LIM zinc-binding domain-containing protein n=1 Tax=Strongyloides stercoralis TaxID=6248 RepID=A0A0K0E6J3_STRER